MPKAQSPEIDMTGMSAIALLASLIVWHGTVNSIVFGTLIDHARKWIQENDPDTLADAEELIKKFNGENN